MPILNLNEGVPRTYHSAHNLNARVPRTCFENILPGLCTENIYKRAQRLQINTSSGVARNPVWGGGGGTSDIKKP